MEHDSIIRREGALGSCSMICAPSLPPVRIIIVVPQPCSSSRAERLCDLKEVILII
jgi:hypothetical protein